MGRESVWCIWSRSSCRGKAPTDGSKAGNYNFVMEQLGLFNRMEWMKTQPTLPGKPNAVIVGYEDITESVYSYETVVVKEPKENWEWVGTGVYQDEPVLEWQVVGQEEKTLYNSIHHPATAYEPAWTENIAIGTEMVDTVS